MGLSLFQPPSQVQVVHTATIVQSIDTKHSESLEKTAKQLTPPTLAVLPSETLMTQESPKQPAIVDGIIPTSLIIVVGKPKVGKSCAMLNLVLACASPEGVLCGQFPVNNQLKSLCIAFESTPLEMQSRIRQIMGNETIPPVDFVGLEEPPTFQLRPQGLASLKAVAIKNQYKLVIIDTLEQAKQEVIQDNGNAYERDTKLLIPVQ